MVQFLGDQRGAGHETPRGHEVGELEFAVKLVSDPGPAGEGRELGRDLGFGQLGLGHTRECAHPLLRAIAVVVLMHLAEKAVVDPSG